MTQVTEHKPAETSVETDLVAAVHHVLQTSDEPMTISKIRAHLPASLRTHTPEELAEILQRQVAAKVLCQYPKYRSQQDRFWDRPMGVHVARLLAVALGSGPLPWSELRRKLPTYAQGQAESVLEQQVSQGLLYRHPRSGRVGERFGAQPPDPKEYLRSELMNVFTRLEQLGFRQTQLREGALELLHEEVWASAPTAAGQTPAHQDREHAPEDVAAATGARDRQQAHAPSHAPEHTAESASPSDHHGREHSQAPKHAAEAAPQAESGPAQAHAHGEKPHSREHHSAHKESDAGQTGST
jgi:hypothetical protein